MSHATLPTSPYCTIGPFFPGSFCTGCEDMTHFEGKQARGQHIFLKGRIFEEGHRPILNAIIEIWQPDASGIFRHPLDPRFHEADPGFLGWGRVRTDAQGQYCFRTVLPGAPLNGSGTGQRRCPHLNLMVLAIGVTRRLVTTVFFADDPESVRDPALDRVPDSSKRRMFASRETNGNAGTALPVYAYDIVTRGEAETPFFVD